MADLNDRKVLMIVPPARFTEQEYDTVRQFLERKKVTVKTANATMRESFGMGGTKGGRVKPNMTIDDVNVADYDAIVFIGGMGTREYWDDPRAHRIAREAVETGRILGATSTAPVILARAGLLDGKEATVYFSETKQITDHGAKYTGASVAAVDRIITCKGPEAVEKFSLALIKFLTEVDTASGRTAG